MKLPTTAVTLATVIAPVDGPGAVGVLEPIGLVLDPTGEVCVGATVEPGASDALPRSELLLQAARRTRARRPAPTRACRIPVLFLALPEQASGPGRKLRLRGGVAQPTVQDSGIPRLDWNRHFQLKEGRIDQGWFL
jgi:hypothetical protein